MSEKSFLCEKCKYTTNIKQNYEKHLLCKKHLSTEIKHKNDDFLCVACKKIYASKSGLWKHHKICKSIKKPEIIPLKNVISTINENQNVQFEKQNVHFENQNIKIEKMENQINELKNIIMMLVKKDPTPFTTINNTNNFNIAIFLNEQCKNAKNLIDFIREIPIELEHVLKIGEVGYVDGVTKILKDELKKYSIYERPIHYHITNESEQNTIHIRDENKWKNNEGDVKGVFDKSINTLDRKLDRTFSKYAIDKRMTGDAYREIKNHTGILRDNTEEQKEIVKNIAPAVKVP